jgi:hypothetical protein
MSSRTKQKRVSGQLLEQNPIIVGTILYVISNKNKCSVRTNQNKSQNMLLLWIEQDFTIARTTYYYSQNKFVCHLEKKSVRTNENKC